MGRAEYSVHPLGDISPSWRVKRKIRKMRRAGRTGVVVHAIIRTPSQGMTFKDNSVWVSRGSDNSARVSSHSRRPKWLPLPPGRHSLEFHAARITSSSDFERSFALERGQILVAICFPIQPWTIFGKSPSTDRWYLGTV
ncbi:hypothetical protein AB0F15_42300 [Amycolatopsis sp. NPDC026612]|uniref:hypothetical protein n=1 Tax=Amycolatopsis sp. NPDC026612 TaxID=3155466 RepID=UPI0033F5E2EE